MTTTLAIQWLRLIGTLVLLDTAIILTAATAKISALTIVLVLSAAVVARIRIN